MILCYLLFVYSNLKNRTEAERLGFTYDELWQTHYVTFAKMPSLKKCETFNPPTLVRPNPLAYVQFQFAIPAYRQAFIKVHEYGNLVGMTDRHLGGGTLAFAGQETKLKIFDIIQRKVVRLPSGENPCTTNTLKSNVKTFKECLNDFVRSRMNCDLPWTKSNNATKRPCDRISDFEGYMNETSTLYSGTDTLEDVEGLTGCRRSCEFISYKFQLNSEGLFDPNIRNNVLFNLADQSLQVERETITYDLNSFIADVGGYLVGEFIAF